MKKIQCPHCQGTGIMFGFDKDESTAEGLKKMIDEYTKMEKMTKNGGS